MTNKARSIPSALSDTRLDALRSYDILDTPPEKAFDDIVGAAAAFCEAPIALVSLVDRDRQWFKACLGLNVSETPVDQAVCAIAIRQADPLIIPDLALDPRTAANPLVTHDPRIRFYAGAPLVTGDGHALGTLCVIDTEPRPQGLSRGQLVGLQHLARQVTHLIEMRSAVEERDASIISHRQRGDEAHARVERIEKERLLAEERGERSTSAQEAGGIGTFELNVLTNVADVSAEFCRLYGLPESDKISAEQIEQLVLPDVHAAHSSRDEREAGNAELDVEYRIRRPDDGKVRWMARRARFDRGADGQVLRMFGTVHDITDRRLATARIAAFVELGDALREADSIADTIAHASRILGRELAVGRVGYATINRFSASFHIERDWTRPDVPSLVGTHPLAALQITLDRLASHQTMSIADVPNADWLGRDRDAYREFGAQALINVPLVIRNELVGVLFVHAQDSRAWTDVEIEFAHGVADRAYATIAQLEAEKDRNLLNLELSHRMKNMLAMVQAIANQTLRNVTEREVVSALNDRLTALGTAHDVLLQDHWAAASVGGVIERVLSAVGALDRTQVEGPAISFGPRAALALSLLVHELATNAIKYGALSNSDGQVTIRWRIEGVGREAVVRLDWRETGGPSTVEPARKGFGSRLIKMGLLGTGGTVTRFRPSGFEADFAVSLDRANAE